MKVFRNGIFVLSLLLFAAAARAADPEAVTLEMKFHKGDVYRYVCSAEMEFSVINQPDGASKPMPVNLVMNMESRYRMEVLDVSATGTADVELTYQDLRYNVGNSALFDSARDGGDETNPFSAMLRNPIRMRMTRDGRVTDIQADWPEMKDVPFKMDSLLQLQQPQFPSHPVRIGDSWENALPFGVLFGMDAAGGKDSKDAVFTVKSTLAGFEPVKDLSCARLRTTFSGDLAKFFNVLFEKMIPAGRTPGVKLTVNKSRMDIQSDLYFAFQEGFLAGGEFSGTMEMGMKAKSEKRPKDSGTMDMRVRMKGTIELE